MLREECNTIQCSRLDSWHMPPPIPSVCLPQAITNPGKYPFRALVFPTACHRENVSPGRMMIPLMHGAANARFLALFSCNTALTPCRCRRMGELCVAIRCGSASLVFSRQNLNPLIASFSLRNIIPFSRDRRKASGQSSQNKGRFIALDINK